MGPGQVQPRALQTQTDQKKGHLGREETPTMRPSFGVKRVVISVATVSPKGLGLQLVSGLEETWAFGRNTQRGLSRNSSRRWATHQGNDWGRTHRILRTPSRQSFVRGQWVPTTTRDPNSHYRTSLWLTPRRRR